MSDFQQFIQYRALARKFELQNIDLTEAVLGSDQEPVPLRNVCAKLTVELAERVDNTAAVLGITKRLFIERALIEAMDQADAMLTELGVFDAIEKEIER